MFAELIDPYPAGFPPDEKLRVDLIGRGFSSASADSVVSVFRRSLKFAGIENAAVDSAGEVMAQTKAQGPAMSEVSWAQAQPRPLPSDTQDDGEDRIPIRLTGGRKAWLIIPMRFYEADKVRLKAQIDVLYTDDRKSGVLEEAGQPGQS